MIGAYHLTLAQIVIDLNPSELVDEHFNTLLERIKNQVDTLCHTLSIGYARGIFYVKNYLKYNPIYGAKQISGAVKQFDTLPVMEMLTPLAEQLLKLCIEANLEPSESLKKYPFDTPSIPYTIPYTIPLALSVTVPVPVTETVTETETENRKQAASSPPPPPPLFSGAPEPEINTTAKKPPKSGLAEKELFTAIDAYTQDEPLRRELKIWASERKKVLKKPLSVEALKRNLNNLDKLADNDAERVLIVSRSIEGAWSGFWPLKGGTAPPSTDGWRDTTDWDAEERRVDERMKRRMGNDAKPEPKQDMPAAQTG
jgi:hypothetical protein